MNLWSVTTLEKTPEQVNTPQPCVALQRPNPAACVEGSLASLGERHYLAFPWTSHRSLQTIFYLPSTVSFLPIHLPGTLLDTGTPGSAGPASKGRQKTEWSLAPLEGLLTYYNRQLPFVLRLGCCFTSCPTSLRSSSAPFPYFSHKASSSS